MSFSQWILRIPVTATLLLLPAPMVCANQPAPLSAQKLDAPGLARAIDFAITSRLEKEKFPVSGPATDEEFLRRVYLDSHGVIPSAEKVVAFLDRKDNNKRARLVEELLASPRFGQYQADIWTSVLYRVILEKRYSPPKEPLHQWLTHAFNSNMPWDRQAYELITANGVASKKGTVVYLVHSKGVRSLEEITNLTARLFLGRADIKCAQCHNHPFTPLKRNEYWGMAAFFSQLEVVRDKESNGFKNANLGLGDRLGPPTKKKGDVPDGFKVVTPRFLDGVEPKIDPAVPYRKVFGGWAVSAKNPFFARAKVNRTWAHFFGRGLVNPVDEMNELNAPTHPELLALLADQFAANEFDVKYLIRAIVSSETYQRTSRTLPANREDDKLYSHMPMKVLSPRQLFDSLDRIASLSDGARKGAREQFIASFGVLDTTDGELPDATEYNRNLAQQLRMMTANSPFQNLVPTLVKQATPPGQVSAQSIGNLYVRILSRRPSPRELERAMTFVQERGAAGYAELARVLLTTSEFALNH